MGVYIPKMLMPASCDGCALRQINLARCKLMGRSTSHHPTGKPMDENVRPKWCPLVEVKTPHGELIDRSKIEMIELADSSYLLTWWWDSEMDCEITAQTVIEAEE